MGEFEKIASECATVEEALDALAAAGATPLDGIRALMQGKGLPLPVAKAAVCKSSSWPDWDVAQESLVKELENMDI